MQDPHRQHTMYHVAPPERSRSVWQLKNWTEEELLHLPVDQFMKVVTSISPEVNKAYTDFLRNANESWGYQVKPKGATPIIDDFFSRLEAKHHDPDVLIDRVFAGIYKGGAIFLGVGTQRNGGYGDGHRCDGSLCGAFHPHGK